MRENFWTPIIEKIKARLSKMERESIVWQGGFA